MSNVNVILSILPKGELNFDWPLLIEILKDKHNPFICPIPRPCPKGFCMGVCGACLTEKIVVFEQH